MRSRKKIEGEYKTFELLSNKDSTEKVFLEVLLDIRDLLTPKKEVKENKEPPYSKSLKPTQKRTKEKK